MKFNKSIRPEPNRLIKCKGHDWSPFECYGMFIPFKKGSGKRTGQTRFCIRDDYGNFTGDRDTWSDVDTWDYCE